ncbi:protein TWIN LOV 1-like [Zingiber officinale]|uniref:protein TWIN LOV 1-like n=1 Tax=Zingiber officinale TaxID=94328 RepID=UPI001C4B72C3|nr:protein TWIN LOV 1-like [Zingiber officinale]
MLAVLTAPAIGRRADSTSLSPLTSLTELMDPSLRLPVEQSLAARYSEWVAEALDEIQGCFLITDPGIAGHPIVFASRGFLAMSGYSLEEVLGRNGRIFQGAATDRRSVMEIREAIREERTLQISLLNYRKDGTPHWILFHLFPVFGVEDGRVAHFVAVQVPIPRRSRCLRSSAENRHEGGTGRFLVACRNEFRSDYKLGCNPVVELFVDVDNRGLEAEESRHATEQEKEKACDAANSILSTLAHYSKLTGRVISDKRRSEAGISAINSSLVISLGRIKQSFVLTDIQLPQMPIVYASDEFLNLTGYSRHEVLGRECWFLNGPDTDADVLHQIRQSIQAEHSCTVRLLNYRKDRSSFWNLFHISPVRNASGKIAFYVSVQMDENAKSNEHGLSPHMRQLGVVGAVKVAVRSLSMCAGPSRR